MTLKENTNEEVTTMEPKGTNNVVDIQINSIQKTRIRINGDNNSILELNLSDLRIGERLDKGYIKLQENIQKIQQINTEEDDADFSKKLHEIDNDMKSIIDEIFDANVSAVCCKDGTMYDLKDGEFRFESILQALTKLYANNLNSEYNAMKSRVKKNLDKYIPQDHKPKATTKKRKETIQKDE